MSLFDYHPVHLSLCFSLRSRSPSKGTKTVQTKLSFYQHLTSKSSAKVRMNGNGPSMSGMKGCNEIKPTYYKKQIHVCECDQVSITIWWMQFYPGFRLTTESDPISREALQPTANYILSKIKVRITLHVKSPCHDPDQWPLPRCLRCWGWSVAQVWAAWLD